MMMVNQMNNNSAPWPSTIPDQMPWLNPSTCSPETPMQFVGQQAYGPAGQMLPDISACPPQSQTLKADTSIVPQTSVGSLPDQLTNNPFCPQQASGMQLTRLNPIMGQPLDTTHPSYGLACPILNQTGPQQLAAMSNFGSPLTQIPLQVTSTFEPLCQISNHKRNSFEMEDDLTTKEAPPTKQQLSENKLFQRFGSLNLSNDLCPKDLVDPESQPSDDDESRDSTGSTRGLNSRKEFDRYVYLLFKDKKSNGQFPFVSSQAIERLIREEREKLSKAVILWNPPPKNILIEEVDESDDEDELKYKDHRDFLKNPDSPVMMGDVEGCSEISEVKTTEPDDLMLE